MKHLIIKSILLFLIVFGLNVIGLNEGPIGAILVNLCLFGGIVLAGINNRHDMLLFATGAFLFAMRPLGLIPFWSLFLLGIYSMWAWHRKANQSGTESAP